MLDWPTAAVILGILAPIVIAVIKLVPSRGSSNGNGRVTDIDKRLATFEVNFNHLEKQVQKIEQKLDTHAETFIEWLRSQK